MWKVVIGFTVTHVIRAKDSCRWSVTAILLLLLVVTIERFSLHLLLRELFISWLQVSCTASVVIFFIPPACHRKIKLSCWASLWRWSSIFVVSQAQMMFFVFSMSWEVLNFAATVMVSLIIVPKFDKLIVFDLNKLAIRLKTFLFVSIGSDYISLIRCKIIIIISIATIITCFSSNLVIHWSLEITLKRLRICFQSSDRRYILIAKRLALLWLRLEFLLSSKESIFQRLFCHWAVELARSSHQFFFLQRLLLYNSFDMTVLISIQRGVSVRVYDI